MKDCIMSKRNVLLSCLLTLAVELAAAGDIHLVFESSEGAFVIATPTAKTTLVVGAEDAEVVATAAEMLAGDIAAGAGQIVGGTTYGLIEGYNFSTAFGNSLDGILNNMALGGALGVASTVGICYAERINPWNGKPLTSIDVTAADLHLEGDVQRIKVLLSDKTSV